MGAFFKSFWREFGKNTGKRVSNAVYGDKWSTPYRARVNDEEKTSKKKSKLAKTSDSDALTPSYYNHDSSVRINYTPYDPAVMQRIMDMFEEYSVENVQLRREQNRSYEERRREADMKVMAVTKLEIPDSEYGLVDMMGKLLTLADGLKSYGFDQKVKKACLTKYKECYTRLEHEFPDSNQVWHYYFVNMRQFLAGKSCLVKTLLGLTAFFIFILAIGSRRDSDINVTIILLSITVGIPLLCLLWQYLRLRYFKRRNNQQS